MLISPPDDAVRRDERYPQNTGNASPPGATLHAVDVYRDAREQFLSREFRSSYRWLTSCVHRSVGSGDDAEDLAASAFTELAGHEDVFSIRQPRAFLTTIAKRLTFEFWRRRDIERAYLASLTLLTSQFGPSPECIAETVEQILLIDAALQDLSKKAREAFILSQFEGMKYADIGLRLGISASMVRKYVAQALIKCAEAGCHE